jgi:tetratricopeptide (TPR) repeat protein/signal transduction histidine kinase
MPCFAVRECYETQMDSPKEITRSIARIVAIHPIDLEQLRANVLKLCAAPSAAFHSALIKAFKLVESARDECLSNSPHDEVEVLSRLLLELNRATCAIPSRSKYDYFRTIYHRWIAIHPSPKLSDEENVRAVLETICDLGTSLCTPGELSQICKLPYEPKTFYRRLARIHLALAGFNDSEAPAHEIAAMELAAKANELEGQDSNAEDYWLVTAIQCVAELDDVSAASHPDFARIAQIVEQLAQAMRNTPSSERASVRPPLAMAIKRLKKLRSSLCNDDDKIFLSRLMGHLALTLCSPVSDDYVPWQAPNDRYEVYDALRWLRGLPPDDPFAGKLEIAVIEGIRLAQRYSGSELGQARLQDNAQYRAFFYSRYAELCRAAVVYDLVDGNERRALLNEGIAGFNIALNAFSPSPPDHVGFCAPRISQCLRLAGRFAEAEANLRPVVEGVLGLRPETVWEACRSLTIGLVQKARILAEDEPEKAAILLQEGIGLCVRAAHLWEPNKDIRTGVTQREENVLLHSLLAWIHLESCDFETCIRQAEWFVSAYARGGVSQWRARIIGRTQFIRCQALLALGQTPEAADALRDLLCLTSEPQLRVRPLVLLATALSEPACRDELHEVQGMLRETCAAAGPKFACVSALTPLQLEALTSRLRLGAYVRRCRELLRQAQEQVVLDEVPALVGAIRLFFETDDPALLTLLAQADVQIGDTAAALRTLEYVTTLDSSAKTQRIAWIEIGKIYLRRGDAKHALHAFTQSYKLGGRKLASMVFRARVLRTRGEAGFAARLLAHAHVAPNETHRAFAESEWRNILCIPEGTETTALLLRETSDPDFVEMLARALTVRHDIPSAVLQASLDRSVDHDISRELRRAFLKVVNRALARAYFEGHAAGIRFDPLLYSVLERFLLQPAPMRRELIFQLFVTGRDAPLAGALARYSAAALRRIGAVLQSTPTMDYGTMISALQELNHFLRDRLPTDFRPAAYGFRDAFEVNDRLSRLCIALRGLLSRERSNGNEFESYIPNELQHASGVGLLAIEDSLRRLADVNDGPLAAAMTELIPWVLSINLEVGEIRISFHGSKPDELVMMSDIAEAVSGGLSEWCNELADVASAATSPIQQFISDYKLEVRIPLPTPRHTSAIARALEAFMGFLHSETLHVLNSGQTSPEFYRKAAALFPHSDSPCFDEPTWDWAEALYQLLDQQFAYIAAWLCSLPPKAQAERHPRRTLHNLLKKKLQLCLGAFDRSRGEVESAVSDLRETASKAADGLISEVRAEIFDSESFATHAGHVADELAAEFNTLYPATRLVVNWTEEPWVSIHQEALRNLLRNLFHNALEATRLVPHPDQDISVDIAGIHSDDDEIKSVNIVISNPFHRPETEPNATSTGIGVKAARQSVERWSGTFSQQLANGSWTTRVSLPSVSF